MVAKDVRVSLVQVPTPTEWAQAFISLGLPGESAGVDALTILGPGCTTPPVPPAAGTLTGPASKDCQGTAERCWHRRVDGFCHLQRGNCRWKVDSTGANAGSDLVLQEIRSQRDLLVALLKGQEKWVPQAGAKPPEPVSDSEAARVFGLMTALDDGHRIRKAPLGRVFRLIVIEGLIQEAVAGKCGCSPALITLRVAVIEKRMGRPLSELRALASRLGEMELAAKDSRAREIYRRGLTDDTGDDAD